MGHAAVLVRRPTMIYWTSPNGTIRRAQSENADLVGADDGVFAAPFVSNAIVGRNLYDFIDGMDVRHLYKTLESRVLKTGRAISFAYRCDSPVIRREMCMKLSRDAEMIRYESAVIRETRRARPIPLQVMKAPTFVAMCSFCQKYRFPVSSKIWKELETLFLEDSLPDEFRFTHGICEDCYVRAMNG
jgi:hypothetical protein